MSNIDYLIDLIFGFICGLLVAYSIKEYYKRQLEKIKHITERKIEELEVDREELINEIDELKQEIEDNEQIREDFYKPKSPYEIYGLNEKDF